MTQAQLANAIENFQNELIPTIPEDVLNTLMSELQQLIDAGIVNGALSAGQTFPGFTLPDANGNPRTTAEYLASGPLVVSFYRGAWCPYCNLEIKALQARLPEIEAKGAKLVAISPQLPDKSLDQVSQSKLEFDVLSDVGNKLARECGLVFTLPEKLRPIYEAWELDIPGHNGDDRFELPIPASYIVKPDGKIHFAFADMDYTRRLEPDVIIEQLDAL